jgi:hypothetical protein
MKKSTIIGFISATAVVSFAIGLAVRWFSSGQDIQAFHDGLSIQFRASVMQILTANGYQTKKAIYDRSMAITDRDNLIKYGEQAPGKRRSGELENYIKWQGEIESEKELSDKIMKFEDKMVKRGKEMLNEPLMAPEARKVLIQNQKISIYNRAVIFEIRKTLHSKLEMCREAVVDMLRDTAITSDSRCSQATAKVSLRRLTALAWLPGFAVAHARHPLTVCEMAAHPNSFAGRVVTVRAKVITGFEIFAIEDLSGKCGMWLHYAEGGPVAMISWAKRTPKTARAGLKFRRDSEFEKFDTLLNAQMYPAVDRDALCWVCKRYAVTATMTGRVHVAPQGTGFGHLNAYAFQFELQSVSNAVGEDLAGNYNPAQFSPTPVPIGYVHGLYHQDPLHILFSEFQKQRSSDTGVPNTTQRREDGTLPCICVHSHSTKSGRVPRAGDGPTSRSVKKLIRISIHAASRS